MREDSDYPPSAAEARLRTILNSMTEAVFVTDEKGRVVHTNRALDDLISRDVRGRRAKNVIKSKELRAAIRRARKKNEATSVALETEIGERVHSFQAQVAPLPRGEGVVTVLHDVTSLRNADRVRRDFVANASHELRTPLTAIRGFTETLLEGAIDDPTTARRFLQAILRHTQRLHRLAEDLTILSRAESVQQELDYTRADVAKLCRDAAASLDSFAAGRNIKIQVESPTADPVAMLSERALDHILVNLIENAVKYSPEGAVVKVRVLGDTEHVVVEVIDSGPGIAPKYHARIFERFYRVDKGRSREEGGTGLGLSIVRNLVERMGGWIELESELGKGALFRVILPREHSDDAVDG